MQIEKNVTMKQTLDLGGTLSSLAVGDSFVLEKKYQNRLAIYSRYAGVKVKSKSINADQIRVWRVE